MTLLKLIIPRPVLSLGLIFLTQSVIFVFCVHAEAELVDIDHKAYLEVLDSHRGERAVLVNVWATWCMPCVKEFPDIVKLQKKYRDDLQVLFISADFPDAKPSVLKFLEKQTVDWTTYLKRDKDEIFIDTISKKWSGALPATLIYDRSGNEVIFEEGPMDFATFEQHVIAAIAKQNNH